MKLIITIAVILLLAGPLRKTLLANFRLLFSLAIGGVIGFVVAALMVRFNAPAWLLIAGPVLGGIFIGLEIKKFFDGMTN